MKGLFAFFWVLLFLFSMALEAEDLTDDQWLKSTEDISILAEVIVQLVIHDIGCSEGNETEFVNSLI